MKLIDVFDKDDRLSISQMIAKKLLVEFDRVCKEHAIEYFLDAGSLLGAIRDGKFIPWDDDVDVIMFRDEYEKLLKFTNSFGIDFFLQNQETDVNYTWFLPRLLFTKSYAFSNKTSLKPDVKSGLSLDIFIIDNVPDDRFWFKPWLFMVKVLVGMSKRNISFRNYSFFDKCVLMTFQIFNFCLPYKWQKALYKFLTQTVGKSYGYNCMILNHTVKGMSKIIPKGCFDGERYGELDGNSYPIPYDSERVLSILYGENYMDLPPLSMRKPHDFDIFKVSSDVL